MRVQTEQHVVPKNPARPRLFSCSGIVSSVEEPDSAAIQASITQLRKDLKVSCVIERQAASQQ